LNNNVFLQSIEIEKKLFFFNFIFACHAKCTHLCGIEENYCIV
jgi:hypothetical protein